MNEVQKNLFKLLCEVDDICRKNDITYYLAGGTALGAVRGGGFLPWDDDIDLYITRDNWDKLVEVMKVDLPKDRDFVCVENAEYYFNPIGRYVDVNTTMMTRSQILCGRACGQMIEFLIMDPMPISEEGKMMHRQNMKVYTELLTPYFVVNRWVDTENSDYSYERYKEYKSRFQIEGAEKVLKELKDSFTKFSEEDADTYCMRWGISTLMYKKEYFGKPRMADFEGRKFPIGQKAECIFRTAYGDSWMYIPKDEDKEIHKNDKDLNTSYKVYTDFYMPLLDRKEAIKNFREKKEIALQYRVFESKRLWEFEQCRCIIASSSICNENIDYEEVNNWLMKREFDKLENLFKPYYIEQLSPNNIHVRALIRVPDEYLYYAILNRVFQGRYFTISKIEKFYEGYKDVEIGEKSKEALSILNLCRELSILTYDEFDVEKIKLILEENVKWKHIIPDYDKAMATVLLKAAEKLNDTKRLKAFLEESLRTFPDDGELIWYYGKAWDLDGELNKAKHFYNKAIKLTRNGFAWRDAKKMEVSTDERIS